MGDLTKNFSKWEFECPCCGRAEIDMDLVNTLQMIRSLYKNPLVISSGFRCEAHNRRVGGKETSAHLKGKAVDISCGNSRSRFLILNYALGFGISRVGISGNFIHLDIDDELPGNVIWTY